MAQVPLERKATCTAPGRGNGRPGLLGRDAPATLLHTGPVHGSQDLEVEIGHVDSEAAEDLAGPTLHFEQAEQDVGRFDPLVPAAEGEAVGALQGPCRPVGEFEIPARGLAGGRADRLANLAPAAVDGGTEGEQRRAGRAPLVGHQPEQEMLGADQRVSQLLGLAFRPGDHLLGRRAEAVKHGSNLDHPDRSSRDPIAPLMGGMTEHEMERAIERNQLALKATAIALRELHGAMDVLNKRLGRPDEAIQGALDNAMLQLERVRL